MKKIVKQVVGIDVAQDELVVRFGRMYDDWSPQVVAFKSFTNHRKGFEELIAWSKRLSDDTIKVRFVMEATGVYHESLAWWLDEQGYEVSIVLPNKISSYSRTLAVKTVTDKTASETITLFGLERKLDQWKRPKGIYRRLRQLTRERGQLIEERTTLKNQLHAEQAEAYPYKKSIDRMNKRIILLNKQEKEIMEELSLLIKTDVEVQQIVILLCSISGIGLLTAAAVLGETDGFDLIRNKRQLTSYAGLDVIEKQSGTSVKRKSRISKKGNRYLRKAMHFPALTAIRHDEHYKAIFARIISRNGIKMKAAVAVQRKLLEMMFTVFKKQERYDRDYFKKQTKEAEQVVIEKN